MTFYTRTAAPADFHIVFSDLSDISAGEYLQGKRNWWVAMKDCLLLHKYYPAEAVVKDGEVVALIGHNKHPEYHKARVTWFAARPGFFEDISGTRYAKRWLKSLSLKWPGMIFESYTQSKHPYVDRWFRALGFKFISKGDGFAKFVYHAPSGALAPSAA